MTIEMFLLIALLILTALDFKYKKFPSILTTSLIFIVAVVNIKNLPFGVLGFIFAWMMMEGFTEDGEFFSGTGDLKVVVMLSFMVTNLIQFFLLIGLIMICGVAYKIIAKFTFKQKEEIAFVPALSLAYILFLLFKYFIILP